MAESSDGVPATRSQGDGEPAAPAAAATEPTGYRTRHRALQAFESRDFRLLWLSQFTTAMGQWMDQVARGWLLYDLTGSPLQLGLVGVIRVFPLILLSPVAGTMADRYGRKTQLTAAQVLNGAANLILALLILHGGVEPWHVYATGLIAATVQVFQGPARQSMVPESVGRANLTNAIGLNSLAFNISRMLGPAAAGALIAIIGPGGSYMTQAAIFFASTVWTLQLGLPNRAPTSDFAHGRHRRTFKESMFDGWRYVLDNQTIRTGMIISGVISFFGFAATSLLPVFAKDILKAGPQGQGLLLGAMGVGAVMSGLLLATLGDELPKGWIIVGGVTVYGIVYIAFASSVSLALSMGLMVILGICNVASNTVIQTVLQAESSPDMRGRVMGIYQQHQILIAAGGLAAGALASIWSAQIIVAVFGAACALGALAVLFAFPNIRTIR